MKLSELMIADQAHRVLDRAGREVVGLHLAVDDRPVGVVTSPPYQLQVDLGASSTPHSFRVVARDVDPLTDEFHTVVSSIDGEIIGIAFSRPVLSGYALYHVAWHTSE